MAEPQNLPTRFPCWVRAKFGFAGESKHDLGFIEGELIECLNAGDGHWWMGRLFRDKRMMGLFPSNFVEVLGDNFRPATRSTSPMPQRSPSTTLFNPQPLQATKAKPFRKAFSAYSAPNPHATKRAEANKQDSLSIARGHSPAPSVHDNIARVPSPRIRGYGSRASSPATPSEHNSRAPSSASWIDHADPSRTLSASPHPFNTVHSQSRATSPAPSTRHVYGAGVASRLPYESSSQTAGAPSQHTQIWEESSPPPPPPPPHRTNYTPHTARNCELPPDVYDTPKASSRSATPDGTGLTPSPLRSAMDDVMSSLADMETSRNTTSPETPLDPWSPEAFDQTYVKARKTVASGPRTAADQGGSKTYSDPVDHFYDGSSSSRYTSQPPPQLSNYVQRMESRLSKMYSNDLPPDQNDGMQSVIAQEMNPFQRPKSSLARTMQDDYRLSQRRSAFEVGKSILGRTFTTKTNLTSSSSGARSTTTNSTSSSSMTDRSLMSGPSASEFSYTSAGSLARKKEAVEGRTQSALGLRRELFQGVDRGQLAFGNERPQTPLTGISYHSSHASDLPRAQSQAGWHVSTAESGNVLGGLMAPKSKKSGFFKKMIESAKTSAASARSSIAVGESPRSGAVATMPNSISSISGGGFGSKQIDSVASELGLGGGKAALDWVQVRRDVNRSNSLSRIELVERKERCQMLDYPAISPIDELYEQCQGDEGANRRPVDEPTNFSSVNFSLVDKNARFVNSLPPMTNPASLATGYVCRPYRNDIQRLRAIFTWVSEKISWEEDFEIVVDSRKVIQTKRGSAEEVAVLVLEMCAAIGIQAEIIRGYLKTPGEMPELSIMPRPNHWWNAVIVDGEWRMMDCSLASPSHPRRSLFSDSNTQTAASWWFLARPIEICWTHVAESYYQQHLCPHIAHEILLALPCACPPYFKSGLQILDYDTSLLRTEDLELTHIQFTVPPDVECVAEVEARAFERDSDGDFFENGEVVKKRALAQAEWVGGQKRYTVKALLPGDEGYGTLKIYAGKRGLMQSIKDIPHPLAFALPMIHTGDNPPYEFVTRYPTPHAQRHDLYVAQPQCQKLAWNNTFVFAIRQHSSSLASALPNARSTSPIPHIRPGSSMSMTSSSASGSNPSTSSASTSSSLKRAKLAIQAPGGKVLRLMKKEEMLGRAANQGERGDGTTWETIIKVSERGLWRGLVLADRSARWGAEAGSIDDVALRLGVQRPEFQVQEGREMHLLELSRHLIALWDDLMVALL